MGRQRRYLGARTAVVAVAALLAAGLTGLGAPAGALTSTTQPTLTLNRLIRTSPFVGSSTTVRDNEDLAYVPSDDSLWMADDNGNAVYEVNRTTGALKRTVSQTSFINAHQFGGSALATKSRNEDIEAVAYDRNADVLYVFSGSTSSTPTVYRFLRDGSHNFQIDSWQPLPTEWTGAGWRLADGKLYVADNTSIRTYDYVSNTFGTSFSVSGLKTIYDVAFDTVTGDMLAVSKAEALVRVNMTTHAYTPGWSSLDLTKFGMKDTRGVEVIGEQVFVSDGYDFRSSSDPMNHAIFVFDVSGPNSTPPPTAAFTASPTSGTAPLSVQFTDTSTGSPTSWAWDFGDGGTSIAQNPSHQFTGNGIYTVQLTATNLQGSDSTTRTVTVADAPPPPTTVALDADTYFNTSSPTKNYGAYTVMKLHSPTTAEYRPLVRFTLSGLSGPPTSVKLHLYVTDGSDNCGSWYSVSNSWTESTVTWNTKPDVSGSPAGNAGACTTGQWVDVDVTSAITGNGTYSFEATSGSTNTAEFSSREGTNAPQVLIVP
jgi:PKD repeat protein